MTYDELKTLSPDALLAELQSEREVTRNKQDNLEYYEGKHPITTDPDRKDFTQPLYEKDDAGNIKQDTNGNPIKLGDRNVTRARMVLSYPKQIVTTKTAMIAGNGITIVDDLGTDDESFNIFKDVFEKKLKIPSKIKDVIKTTAIETECALLFYLKDGDKEKPKVNLLSYANGDDIYPYFDSDGDLIAFTRAFTEKAVVEGQVTERDIVQAYFQDKIIVWTDGVPKEITNPYGKIPIVYFDQVYPEFKDSKDLITKQEYAISQHYEVNRRIGNPPVLITGDVSEMPDPAADVKTFKASSGSGLDGNEIKGDVKLVEATTAPESLKLQFENIDKNIERASWMDLSQLMEAAKGTGLSGFALQVAMTNAFATRSSQISTYDDGLTRIISIVKTMLANSGGGEKFENLQISGTFNPLLPDDLVTQSSVLAEAVIAGTTSRSNAIKNFSLNNNPAKIEEQVKQQMNENA